MLLGRMATHEATLSGIGSLPASRAADDSARCGWLLSQLANALHGGLVHAAGGYTTGRKEVVEVLRQRARPYLFSNTLAPPVAAASIEAFDMLEGSPALRDTLEANTKYFRKALTEVLPSPRPHACNAASWVYLQGGHDHTAAAVAPPAGLL